MKDRRSLLGSLCLFSTLCAFLGGLIGSSTHFLLTENREYGSYYTLPLFCLPCADLALHPDDPHEGIIQTNNGTECCANSTDSIPVLVDYYTLKWSKEELYEKNPTYQGCKEVDETKSFFDNKYRNNPDKQFFKILGYPERKLPPSNHRTVHWDEASQISSSNLSYKHGHVIVGVDGLYQIYSQIVINYKERLTNVTGTPNLFLHAISLKKSAGERHIISSTLSQCKSDPENAYITSHIGAVHHFSKGDGIVVKLSYPEDIVPSEKMNFFGIHMI